MLTPPPKKPKLYFQGLVGCYATLSNTEEEVIIASEPYINGTVTQLLVLKRNRSLEAVSLNELKLNYNYLQ